MDTILVSLNSKMKLTKSTPMGYFFLFVSYPFFFFPISARLFLAATYGGWSAGEQHSSSSRHRN
jgi:hypothetical protein